MDNKETYLLVMKSVFSTRFKIHKKYDLKGSTVDRQASSKEKVSVYDLIAFLQIKYIITIYYFYLALNPLNSSPIAELG